MFCVLRCGNCLGEDAIPTICVDLTHLTHLTRELQLELQWEQRQTWQIQRIQCRENGQQEATDSRCFLFIKSINWEGATRSMVRKFQKHISQLMVADFKQSISGSWVLWLNNSYCPFSTFFPFSHLCSEGFIKRWQWIMRGAKGEISRPSHSLSSL